MSRRGGLLGFGLALFAFASFALLVPSAVEAKTSASAGGYKFTFDVRDRFGRNLPDAKLKAQLLGTTAFLQVSQVGYTTHFQNAYVLPGVPLYEFDCVLRDADLQVSAINEAGGAIGTVPVEIHSELTAVDRLQIHLLYRKPAYVTVDPNSVSILVNGLPVIGAKKVVTDGGTFWRLSVDFPRRFVPYEMARITVYAKPASVQVRRHARFGHTVLRGPALSGPKKLPTEFSGD